MPTAWLSTRYAVALYTIRTRSVHHLYPIRTPSAHHVSWLYSGLRVAIRWLSKRIGVAALGGKDTCKPFGSNGQCLIARALDTPKSGRGQPHSKTLRKKRTAEKRGSVLECGCPLPLSWTPRNLACLLRVTDRTERQDLRETVRGCRFRAHL